MITLIKYFTLCIIMDMFFINFAHQFRISIFTYFFYLKKGYSMLNYHVYLSTKCKRGLNVQNKRGYRKFFMLIDFGNNFYFV